MEIVIYLGFSRGLKRRNAIILGDLDYQYQRGKIVYVSRLFDKETKWLQVLHFFQTRKSM